MDVGNHVPTSVNRPKARIHHDGQAPAAVALDKQRAAAHVELAGDHVRIRRGRG